MFKLAWKYIKGYKKNTMVCIMGIAFSVMLIFSLVGISNRIMNQYQNMLLNSSSLHDARIHDISSDVVEDIYNNHLPEDCEKMINQWCGTIYSEKANVSTLVIAVEGSWQTFHRVELKEGKEPEKPYEVCIEEKYAKEYGVKVSDELTYELYDDAGTEHKVTFKVTGIVSNVPSSSMAEYIFTSYSTSKELVASKGFVVEPHNNAVLYAFDLYKISEDKESNLIGSLMDQYGTRFYADHMESNEDKYALLDEEGTYTDISKSFYGICAVVFICMTVFIYNAISINMTEKIRQYGTLRCIGMSNKRLTGIMLIEQLFYTFVGLGIGIAGGKLLNAVIAEKIIGCFINVGNFEATESIWAYGITIAVAVVAVLFAFIGMIIKIWKRKPLEMLRYMEASKEVKVKASGKNVIWNMSNRNIKRNPSKSRILMSTVFIAALLIMLIGNVITSIDMDINKMPSGIADVEVASSFASEEAPYIKADSVEKLKNNEDVNEVYSQRMEFGYDILVEGKVSDKIDGVVVYSDNLIEKFLEFNDVKDIKLSDDIAIVLIENEEDKVSEIALRAENGIPELPDAKREYSLKIDECVVISRSTLVGSQFSGGSYVIVNEKLAGKIMGELDTYTNLYVALKGNVDFASVKEIIGIDEYTYFDLNDTTAEAQNQMIGMMFMALYMMVAVIILNIFVISNIIKSNIALRSKEIGMLRSIGAEKKWIEKSISSEIIILALKGAVAAILVSIPVSMYIYTVINETAGIGWGGYIVGVPVILLGVYLISKVVIKKSMKLEVTEMIKSE